MCFQIKKEIKKNKKLSSVGKVFYLSWKEEGYSPKHYKYLVFLLLALLWGKKISWEEKKKKLLLTQHFTFFQVQQNKTFKLLLVDYFSDRVGESQVF